MTFGSLFAGIGGFDLGFERAGMRGVWQVEIDPYCQKVLAKHWPDVMRHDDVKTFPPSDQDLAGWRVDVICGGFPCQDLSNAGLRAGMGGNRSGLWAEFARIVRVLRPRFVVVENVAANTDGWVGRVLRDLAACGYDAEWDGLPAFAFGAPHPRDRTFIVAYPVRDGRQQSPEVLLRGEPVVGVSGGDGRRLPDPTWREDKGEWLNNPGVPRVANGIPCRVDRLRGTGNAVHPAVAEWIGRRLIASLC